MVRPGYLPVSMGMPSAGLINGSALGLRSSFNNRTIFSYWKKPNSYFIWKIVFVATGLGVKFTPQVMIIDIHICKPHYYTSFTCRVSFSLAATCIYHFKSISYSSMYTPQRHKSKYYMYSVFYYLERRNCRQK